MIQYEKYKSFKPNDQRAENGIKSCVFALDALENPTRYEVTRFQYNSNAADYAPSFGSSDYKVLFFTSSRDASVGKSTDGFSGDKYTDFCVSDYGMFFEIMNDGFDDIDSEDSDDGYDEESFSEDEDYIDENLTSHDDMKLESYDENELLDTDNNIY